MVDALETTRPTKGQLNVLTLSLNIPSLDGEPLRSGDYRADNLNGLTKRKKIARWKKKKLVVRAGRDNNFIGLSASEFQLKGSTPTWRCLMSLSIRFSHTCGAPVRSPFSLADPRSIQSDFEQMKTIITGLLFIFNYNFLSRQLFETCLRLIFFTNEPERFAWSGTQIRWWMVFGWRSKLSCGDAGFNSFVKSFRASATCQPPSWPFRLESIEACGGWKNPSNLTSPAHSSGRAKHETKEKSNKIKVKLIMIA